MKTFFAAACIAAIASADSHCSCGGTTAKGVSALQAINQIRAGQPGGRFIKADLGVGGGDCDGEFVRQDGAGARDLLRGVAALRAAQGTGVGGGRLEGQGVGGGRFQDAGVGGGRFQGAGVGGGRLQGQGVGGGRLIGSGVGGAILQGKGVGQGALKGLIAPGTTAFGKTVPKGTTVFLDCDDSTDEEQLAICNANFACATGQLGSCNQANRQL